MLLVPSILMDQGDERACGLITALLDMDVELGQRLIEEDPDLPALAWSIACLAAGFWDHHSRMLDKEPKEAWADCLLAKSQRS